MLWLVYQCIAKIAEYDSRWNAIDLDPSIIDLTDTNRKFDFAYRSIYSSAMSDTDRIALSGDMHVDYDWGLWGHNLKKVFNDKEIPADAMATVNGKKTATQFCFSSETLMKAVSYFKDEIKDKEKTDEYIELLKGYKYFKNMTKYREAYGNISDYIEEWEKNTYYRKKEGNRISVKENEYSKKLTDGYYGSASDYHTHWVIFKKDINEINVTAEGSDKRISLELSFLNAPKWKISPPSKIEVFQGNALKGSWTSNNKAINDFSTIKADIDISDIESGKGFRILIYKGNKPQMAIDEIDVLYFNQ